MMTYEEQAGALYEKGYNCAQAVFVPFAQAHGIDFHTAMRAAASLGGGLGHSGETCGAVLGMCMAMGLEEGPVTSDPGEKKVYSAKVKAVVDAFRERFGETRCDALQVPGDRSVCAAFVREAAKWAQGVTE